MRVLQVHTRYRHRGGEDAVVDAERALLARSGHAVELHLEMNPDTPGAAAAALAASMWNLRAARRVADAIERFAPDVVHVHNTWFGASPSVLAACTEHRVPVVMTLHNFRLACTNSLLLRDGAPCEKCIGRDPWPAVRHRCYRGSAVTSAIAAAGIAVHRRASTWERTVDRFIALSAFARGRLVRAGLPADRMVLGSNFVPDSGPRAITPSASDEVLFVGRISAEKGLHVLLDAWRAAPPVGLRLVVLGDGPDRAALTARAPAGVEFTGRLAPVDVMSRVRAARALVLPSVWYEGQPVAALEGLASGTPLVLSDIGGLPEVLGDEQAGWLVPPRDTGSLAAALDELRDGAAVDKRGAAARRRYEQAFTPDAALSRLQAVYSDAADRCPA
jgi:glycosyltransferase involved in cell wall biosynthesis